MVIGMLKGRFFIDFQNADKKVSPALVKTLSLFIFACAAGLCFLSADIGFWWSIAVTPEPERCALCESGIRRHAPCLLDPATGAVGELQVYDNAKSKNGELAEIQTTGWFSLMDCLGSPGCRDSVHHTCRLFFTQNTAKMEPSIFCSSCRYGIAKASSQGCLLIDLYDNDNIRFYQITECAEYEIRQYSVSIEADTEPHAYIITVCGHLDT